MLTNQQFDRMRRLALRLAGIELVDRHRDLLRQRGRRMGILDDAAFDGVLDAAEKGDATAAQCMLRLLTTKHTGFFRHPAHFQIAAERALAAADRLDQARCWSAAAATGEEPYSLAMVLIESFGQDDPPVSILATDVDVEALTVARQGEYGEQAIQAIDAARRERFFRAADGARRWSIDPAVKRLVDFRPLNLAGEAWPVERPFEVIFCRNLLMYLGDRKRAAVVERMASLLVPNGLLILDPVEHPGSAAGLFNRGADGVYSRRSEAFPQKFSTISLGNPDP